MARKNPAAVALGKLGGKASSAKLTPAERSERAKKAALARAASLTPEQRKAIAAQGGRAKKRKNKP